MECPDCGTEMIWQNDWDIDHDDVPDNVAVIQTDHECPECELYLSIVCKHVNENVNEGENEHD